MTDLRERLALVPIFDLNGFKLGKEIGTNGANGRVYIAVKGNEIIAVKKFIYRDDDSYSKKLIEREIICLQKCQKSHKELIIGLLGISFKDFDGNPLDIPYLIMNYAQHGTLQDILNKHRINPEILPLYKKMFFLREIARGLEWIHYNKIVHRDIKPENIFLDADDNILIGDFGTSRMIDENNDDDNEKKGTVIGTIRYESPEVLNDNVSLDLIDKTDVFSFGALMCEVLTGKKIYEFALDKISNREILSFWKNQNSKFEIPLPSYYNFFLNLLLNQNPKVRPSFKDIVKIFDAGIIIPEVLSNDNDKARYFNMISDPHGLEKKKCLNLDNLNNLYNEFENKQKMIKLASVVLFFMADFMNDSKAQTIIGRRYIENCIYGHNPKLGYKYLEKASNQKYAEALFYFGLAIKFGYGNDKKKDQNEIALEKIRESSDMGCKFAKKYLEFESHFQNIKKTNLKMAIVGSYNSGKTTFINKLKDKYDFSYTTSTISCQNFSLMCKSDDDDDEFLVHVIDTSGTEEYHSYVKNNLRNVNLTIIMYEIDNPSSFEEIDYWFNTLREVNNDSKLLIVGNKIDLERNVLKINASNKAEEYNAPYLEVSALYGDGIENCYHKICHILNKYRKLINHHETMIIDINETNNQKTGILGWMKNYC